MDRQRLAEALAYEQQRRSRLANVIPTAQPGDPEVIPEQGVRSRLENLSSGLGQGAVNTLEGMRQLVTSPIETGRAMVEGGVEMIRDPALIAEALRETGRRAASGPLGLGEVIGESLNPMRARSRPVMQEIDVYHGSPHRFEEFDASKIGTGEGSQAYGMGTYLAEARKTGEAYQGELSRRIIPEEIKNKSPIHRQIAESVEQGEDLLAAADAVNAPWVQVRKVMQELEAYPRVGYLYTADLPDEMVTRMLDWEKPLSQQSPAVKKIIAEIKNSELWDDATKKLIGDTDIKGSKFYEALASSDALAGKAEFGVAASEELAKRGIPGIMYPDAHSRARGGEITRNFVVFPGEEKKVKILKRE